MFLYTIQVSETPFHKVIISQCLDKELAIQIADAALPYCVMTITIEEWPLAENIPANLAPEKNKYISGIDPKCIYSKSGTRELTKSQQAGHEMNFI